MRTKYALCSLALMVTTFGGTAHAGDIAQGKAKAAMCAGCHTLSGIGLTEEYPNLAGQKEAYLVKQLKAFKSGIRTDPTMDAMVKTLSDTDITNLAAYFSSLNPAVAGAQPAVVNTAGADKATANEFPETTFISMKKSAQIQTFPQQETWEGGPNMLYDAVTPDGKMVLSTSPSDNTLYVFDANSGKQLAIIKVGKAPKGVKVTPDGKFAYVSNQGSAEVSVIDLGKLALVDSIKVEEGPHNTRFTKDGKLAYVTLQGGAGIAVIDTAARKMTRVIPVPGITGPHNLDLSADEKTAYVRDFVHHVAVLDLESGKVKKVLKVGNGHGGIDVAPNDKFVATAAIGDKVVTVIDPQTLEMKNIEVGEGPHGIRASKDSRWIYVTLTKENSVVVINAATMQVEKRIAVGKFPFWVAVQGNP